MASLLLLLVGGLLAVVVPVAAALDLAPAEIVAAGGTDLVVAGYSVPVFVDWNADTLADLVVGEGGGTSATGKVRVYLNAGAPGAPVFGDFAYVQAAGVDLAWPASGCLGIYPSVVQWNDDGRKDLIVGLTDGRVRLYLNTGTDEAPAFDAGVFLALAGADLDVGYRATPTVLDWDGDGRKDLVVGALDGRVRVYLNSGTQYAPVFLTEAMVPANGTDLLVPSGRSSLCHADLDGDGNRDLLTGNTDGQLLLYHNGGTDTAPVFAGYSAVTAGGSPIDLDGTPRSRPYVCDWNDDQVLDVLVGSGDGKVRLYRGLGSVSVPQDLPDAGLPLVSVYPNPFNPRARVTIELARPGVVVLSIVAATGDRVLRREMGSLAAGRHELTWDGRDGAGRAVPSGAYLVKVEAGGLSATTRATLVR
jgi:hypothetical protein